ncbi:hypothetical protein DSO57_1021145 [Entomophthora muscae]|uniref:Uncharacterized protein n=1 Tax=Entomophthora muscae TaxID=34485 RepID=A0ACC2RUI0_9FUNG|nr:hypothetical protein DSO57_1021145 [Entomophthora muscae]
MPQIDKLTLEESFCIVPVLCLSFQTNSPSYISDTKKVLGVAAMISGDALKWFGKATSEDFIFCLNYINFEAKLMQQPAASHPLPSSQSEDSLTCDQLNKSLTTGPKIENNPCPPEQGQTKASSLSTNSGPNQWRSGTQTTWLGPDLFQTQPSSLKLDMEGNLGPFLLLAIPQPRFIDHTQ